MSSDLKVGIVTCDEDDFAAMAPAADLLTAFDVPYEIVAIDLYRTPQLVVEYAERARDRGLMFILAGTGNTPGLPSMLASHTSLPVLGVPLRSKMLGGEAPPYSVVQMSDRVPVATVASGDARGAALIAVRTLALGDEALNAKLRTFHDRYEQDPAQDNGEHI